MARFLDGSDDARATLLDAVRRVADAVAARDPDAGRAWSGADAAELRTAIDALDPVPDEGRPFNEVRRNRDKETPS